MSQLDQLREMTVVVADSGDFSSFGELKPQDATTNPTLLLAAAKMEQYQHLLKDALDYARSKTDNVEEQLPIALDRLAINFGVEILNIVPGRVSTEIDARLSYDTEATVRRAKSLYRMYEEVGINPIERVLFKIASTWEGIKAAEILESEGIHTNLTLLFSLCQAIAAAESGVTLISPFVGRILDFWKKETGKDGYPPQEDPGVIFVTRVYHYYKKFGYDTIVMGASFRNKDEIVHLAGCDYLTIAPSLLKELSNSHDPLPRKLIPEESKNMEIVKLPKYDEKRFRWDLGMDPCGTSKLAEGIRRFAEDTEKLEQYIRQKLKELY